MQLQNTHTCALKVPYNLRSLRKKENIFIFSFSNYFRLKDL